MDEEATHPSPHDALFKRVFGDVERGGALLRSILPEALTRAVDWSTLELRPSESVGPELRGLSSDLVFSGRMANRWVLFHVLVEHQSTPDPRMPYRVAEYLVRLWHSHGEVVDGRLELPLIVPIVVYHGARPWRVPLDLGATLSIDAHLASELGSLTPRLCYLLDDLSQLNVAELKARGLPAFATLAIWALRSAFDRGFVSTAADLSGLFDQVAAADDAAQALASLIGYIGFISRPGEDLLAQVRTHLSPRVREEVMELEEMLGRKKQEEGHALGRQEGRVQGRQEGLQEGRQEGRVELLTKLLRLKFGALDAETERRVQGADEVELDRWAERVLTAERLADVFA